MFDNLVINNENVRFFWNQYQMLDCVVVLVIFIISILISSLTQPYCRPFSWKDPTIDYPYITNVMFPIWTLVFFLMLALVLYGFIVKFLGGLVWVWIKAQLMAVLAQFIVIDLLKVFAGRIRPDYLNRLRHYGFDEFSYAKSNIKDISEKEYYCNLGNTNANLREGRLSFPSGHSSTSFAIFAFMSLFLIAHTRPSSRGGSFLRLLLSLFPLTIAFVCAISRTRDYWHHFDDILAGAIIGTISAWLSFHNAFRLTAGGLCVARITEEIEEEERERERERGGHGGSPPVTVQII